MRTLLPALLLALFLALPAAPPAAEEAPVLSISAEGSSTHSLEKHTALYTGGVTVSYGGLTLKCARLEISFLDDDRTPRSLSALAASPSDPPRKRAAARLVLKTPDLELRCARLDASFHDHSAEVASVTASGDVWARIPAEGFTVHCETLRMDTPPGSRDFTAVFSPGPGVTRVELAGKGFAASTGRSTLARKKDSLLLEGADIDVFFNTKPGRTILPPALDELRASRLNVRAASFRFEPDRHSFAFSGGSELRFGSLGVRARKMLLLTDAENRLPSSLSASGEPAALRWKGMELDSPSLRFDFSKKGELARFTARGKTSVRVANADGRRIEADCSSAVWEADRIAMTGEPDVIIRVPSRNLTIRERKSEFFLKNGRWEHKGEGSRTEISR